MQSRTRHSLEPRTLHSQGPTADPALLSLGADLLWQATQAETEESLLGWALPAIGALLGADHVALAGSAAGRWVTLAASGAARQLPMELLANALDREITVADAQWIAAPLASRAEEGEVLAVHLASKSPSPVAPSAKKEGKGLAAVAQIAPVLHQSLDNVRRRSRQQRRLRRLEAVLEIVGQWNQTSELEPLLIQMAEAASRLLQADRASIFLWDRPNHTLVGRPALGLPGGELRIRDDRGVVGEVIRTGQPRRVDAAIEPARRRSQRRRPAPLPDAHVVVRSPAWAVGRIVRRFELINKLAGTFSKEDEEALAELAAHAAVALENAQDRRQLLTVNRQMAEEAAEKVRLIGESPTVEALRSIIRRVADTDLAVLILGENGTGKEVVAQLIHYLSRRRDQPFVAVNCAAIPETLAESELFGHEKGAFTDAHEARQGKFELAAGGTLFLDEIGDLSLSGQAKLLRVIEEKVLVRVGGSTPIHTDARLLAATNQNLAEMVRAKRFREDLYFRLNVVTLDLPPLRERQGDILLLAEHFLNDFCRRARRKTPELSAAARKRLMEHPWPGNIRELRNLMERLAYLSAEDRIEAADLAFILSPRGQAPSAADLSQSFVDATAEFQIDYIRRQIEQSGGNMSLAASRLGLHRSNLYRKMRQLGMETS